MNPAERHAKHRVNQVEIELSTNVVELGRALSDRISRIWAGRVRSLLEKVCTEVSPGPRPIRVDKLEIDLGALAPDTFEEDFLKQLEPALTRALETALRSRGGEGGEGIAASLELLETFALTGNLPWWADPSEDKVVARNLAWAATEAETELRALLVQLARDPGALERLQKTWAQDVGLDEGELGQGPFEAGSYGAWQARFRELYRPNTPKAEEPNPDREQPKELSVHPLGEAKAQGGSVKVVDSRLLSDGSRAVSGPERTRAEAVSRAWRQHRSRAASSPEQAASSPEQAASSPEQAASSPEQAASSPEQAAASSPEQAASSLERARVSRVRRQRLALIDEVYVEDAGLVLLWPFLASYFRRVELCTEEGGFLNAEAQMRAVVLIHALATEDPSPPEYRLTLPKLLCGWALEWDFDQERSPSIEVLEEGERMLAAVLDHMPGLAPGSIEGLRDNFLRRPGALSAQSGSWLLRVEGRAEDVALDHMPWSRNWVRLPWMPDPLRVEW